MKQLIALLTLGSFSVLSADQFNTYYPQGQPFYQSSQSSFNADTDSQMMQGSVTSDQQLTNQITSTLQNKSSSFQNISVNVINGVVTLTGNVDTAASKNVAENTVRSISGVKQVRNQITVGVQSAANFSNRNIGHTFENNIAANTNDPVECPNYMTQRAYEHLNPADQSVALQVQESLVPGRFSDPYQNVAFEVSRGIVILTGNVTTADAKRKIEANVRQINGVKQVNNLIAIGQPTTISESSYQNQSPNAMQSQDFAATSADRTINKQIREALKGGWFTKGFENIVINTQNGVVTITGFVDSTNDIDKINDKLANIDGIQSLNNQVQVQTQ